MSTASKNPLYDLPITKLGPSPGEARAVTLLLHGRGRTPAEMIALAERIALPDMAFLALAAAEGSWYPQSFLARLEDNQPHLDWAIARIDRVVADLMERGTPRERIAIVGFSQGACLASEYVHRTPGRWGGLAALTGGVIGPRGAARAPSGDLHGTPIFMAISDIDAWVPLDRVKETAALFTAMGAVVDVRVYPGLDHFVSDDQIDATRALLAPLVRG